MEVQREVGVLFYRLPRTKIERLALAAIRIDLTPIIGSPKIEGCSQRLNTKGQMRLDVLVRTSYAGKHPGVGHPIFSWLVSH